jgi:hypothetical protein
MLKLEGWERLPAEGPYDEGQHYTPNPPGGWKEWSYFPKTDFEFAIVRNPISRFLSCYTEQLWWQFHLSYKKAVNMWENEIPFDKEWLKGFMDAIGIIAKSGAVIDEQWFREAMQYISTNAVPPEGNAFAFQIVGNWVHTFQEDRALQNMWIKIEWILDFLATAPLYANRGYPLPSHPRDSVVNLVVPYSNCFSEKTVIYRLEDGLDALTLDLKKRKILSEDAIFPHANKSVIINKKCETSLDDYPALKDRILDLYLEDFELYGYSFEESCNLVKK